MILLKSSTHTNSSSFKVYKNNYLTGRDVYDKFVDGIYGEQASRIIGHYASSDIGGEKDRKHVEQIALDVFNLFKARRRNLQLRLLLA